jgi:hypothetical protein
MPEKNETTTITADGKTVDIHTGEILDDDTEEIEDMTETEMRAFDGDIDDSENLPDINPSAFDKEVLCLISDLLGDTFIVR